MGINSTPHAFAMSRRIASSQRKNKPQCMRLRSFAVGVVTLAHFPDFDVTVTDITIIWAPGCAHGHWRGEAVHGGALAPLWNLKMMTSYASFMQNTLKNVHSRRRSH